MTNELTMPLVLTTAGLSVACYLAYIILARWWQTRSGRAYFALFTGLLILAAWFTAEGIVGQLPAVAENVVIVVFAAILAFNLWTIVYKQWHFRGKDKP